ncbi:MAG: threonine synthase [bacterium]|jgi:threonine synthase
MFVCPHCQARYGTEEPIWRCTCGSYLNPDFDLPFEPKRIAKDNYSLWRYSHALPLAPGASIVTLGEGFTPLLPLSWRGKEILFKLDYLCPSGSFKDRGTTLLVSQLETWGIKEVVEDSSGNAGASLATYAARAGINCTIYVPAKASRGKLVQIALSGAHLVAVPGSREDTTRAVLTAAENTFYASHNLSPLFTEGVKTLAFELAEQLDWSLPDSIIVPAGNGSLVLGLAAGMQQLWKAGVISTRPRLIAVQTSACAPLATAFAAGQTEPALISKGETLAEGIASSTPPRGHEVLAAVRESGGTFVTVSEEEIISALLELARCGIYVEPTSATVGAALNQCLETGTISRTERVVVVLTGSGLKATDKLLEVYGRRLDL